MPLNPNADIVFADGPLAAPHQPEKPSIRRIFKQVEQAIEAFSAGAGSIAKAIKVQLDADLDYFGSGMNAMIWAQLGSSLVSAFSNKYERAGGSNGWQLDQGPSAITDLGGNTQF